MPFELGIDNVAALHETQLKFAISSAWIKARVVQAVTSAKSIEGRQLRTCECKRTVLAGS